MCGAPEGKSISESMKRASMLRKSLPCELENEYPRLTSKVGKRLSQSYLDKSVSATGAAGLQVHRPKKRGKRKGGGLVGAEPRK